jgi:site-specific recombinase XerC
MRPALDAIAALLTNGRCTNALQYDWSSLNRQQTAAVRAVIADKHYAPRVANQYLDALREVLKECRRLGSISLEDYQQAVDLEPFRSPARIGVRAKGAQEPVPTIRPEPAAHATDAMSRGGQQAADSYLGRLKPSTRDRVRTVLDAMAGVLTNGDCTAALQFNWAAIKTQQVETLRAALVNGPYARSTANEYMKSLRGVLSECRRLGYLSAEAYQRVVDLVPINVNRQPRGRGLEVRNDENRHFLAARDTAILATRRRAELALDELAALDLHDYDRAARSLRVCGERQKERSVVVDDDCKAALDAWIDIRGGQPGPLFTPVLRSRRLTPIAVGVVARRGAAVNSASRLSLTSGWYLSDSTQQ